ncbi:MAG: hypothetical protein AMS27_13030 [Bacteroides sp. SM23_62_1]|nr:MAG: hypothetical protein AMS27_13030 [Bacteroides sp. SM23_62_1]
MDNFRIRILFYLAILIFPLFSCQKEDPEDTRTFLEKLYDLPGVEITEISPPHGHLYAFQLDILQPVDHDNPGGPTFTQRAYLHHVDETRPMVFGPSGYGVTPNSRQELASILGCNMLTVTHRFFKESEPDPYDWEYLTIEKAAADHHHIVDLFKDIYKGVWISSGASKSGQAVLFHKRFWPDDVDATVAYVAPIVFGTKDPRFITFMNNVGTQDCRQKLENYECLLLQKRDSIIPYFLQWFPENNLTFSLDTNEAFEYAVLEYHYAFWQFHRVDCSLVPGDGATFRELADHLTTVLWMNTFSDYYMEYYKPYVYQALTETGYPAYITDHLSDLLLDATDPGAEFFFPGTFSGTYDPAPINDINNWLKTDGDNIIYIYGEYDPWSAAMFEPTAATNAIRVIQPQADHSVRIGDLDEKNLVMETLEGWLGIEIVY